jgi:hypothetical protein
MKWFKVFTVIGLMAFGAVESSAAVSQAERNALMALYNSTDGENWYNNDNWGGWRSM